MIQKGDFVELDFSGFLEDGSLFDTTIKDVAKKNGIEGKNFKPAIVCVGERHLVPGLDDAMIGKELGKFHADIPAEHAFGKKDAKLFKLVPRAKFHNDEIEPFVGLEVSIDDTRGMVRAVSGGRIIVDFNHPLAGHKLHYDVNVLRIITEDKEQVEAAMNLMGIQFNSVSVEGKKATIEMQALPEELKQGLVSEITRLTGMDSVEFKAQPLNKQSSDDASAERGG